MVEPGLGAAVSGGHSRQETAPETSVKRPAGHSVHAEPGVSLKEPAGQGSHALEVALFCVPTAQARHCA